MIWPCHLMQGFENKSKGPMTHTEPRARITSKVRTIDGRRRQEIEAEGEGAKGAEGAKGNDFERAEGKNTGRSKARCDRRRAQELQQGRGPEDGDASLQR